MSVQDDTTIHNHFFSDLLLQTSLFTYGLGLETVLTNVKGSAPIFCMYGIMLALGIYGGL